MTRPTTRTDWLLSVACLSFFGWLFFGLRGLAVGPCYLLLSILIRSLTEKQASSALRRKVGEREGQLHELLNPSMVFWALAYPDDPVARRIVASLPPNLVPRIRRILEQEQISHGEASAQLKILLDAHGVKLAR
jgi:hypothetical protein